MLSGQSYPELFAPMLNCEVLNTILSVKEIKPFRFELLSHANVILH
ncbi:hypothetical protein Enr17x_30550 [Gimesia fumaroli]|uniref:Uncharacterized protein n=1 Tax=Gimesia fumaroli TaxID=2527976 RepID=A0A518ID59_9PLAN|nr:hypothetical protein Enr17x_30550 [Gimesia fumaroli]